MLVISLSLLATVAFAFARLGARVWSVGTALIAAGVVLLWLGLVAGRVIEYLAPNIGGGVGQVIDLVQGEGASRELFQSYVGHRTPPLDRAATFAFTAIILLALPLGWLQIWRTRLVGIFSVAFVVGSLAFPASGLFRLTAMGAELSSRLSAFVFVPVAFCVAMAISVRAAGQRNRAWTLALVLTGAVLLYGGVATGSAAWLRFPGPYLVSADSRSIEPEGISAASWAGELLGPGNRIAVDRVNGLLMMSYGNQRPVTTLADDVDLSPVFFGRRLTPYDRRLLHRGSVRYLVVDYRLTRALPWVGVYYHSGEPGALAHRTPIPRAAFAKFGRMRRVSRVFDSGNIQVFDVSGIARHG